MRVKNGAVYDSPIFRTCLWNYDSVNYDSGNQQNITLVGALVVI
jgi:hypothetical protein